MSTTYEPSNVPTDFTPQQRMWLEQEFQAIKAAMEAAKPSERFQVRTVEPSKYQDGDVVEAASPLDLGSGDGFYIRRAGAWVKLG